MNADDWKNMFAGQESENYDKQVKEEEELKKQKEEAEEKLKKEKAE